jgi:uncharacterized membrane protein YqjE
MAEQTGYRPQGEASVGELVSRVTSDLSTLLRQELELAKAEVKQEAVHAGKAAGMVGAGGVAGLLTLVFLSLTVVYALDRVLPLWLSALVVALLWGGAAGVMFLLGRKQLAHIGPPERTVETVEEDVQWLKTRGR